MFKKFLSFQGSSVNTFVDPDTGYKFSAKTFDQLITEIVRYRKNNSLEPIDMLAAVVENYLCNLPENRGKCGNNALERNYYAYIKGGVSLLKNMLFPKYADQATAETRAAQCSQCIHNVFPDKGPFMDFTDDVAVRSIGERKTSVHNKLGNCDVCTCVLKAKVYWGNPLPPFPPEQVDKLKSVKCWQLTLSGQDK